MVLATGVALLIRGQTRGTIVGLHQASFIVWLGATGVHVPAHAWKLPRLLLARIPGAPLRIGLVSATLVAGTILATATLPQADQLQDHLSAHFGIDER